MNCLKNLFISDEDVALGKALHITGQALELQQTEHPDESYMDKSKEGRNEAVDQVAFDGSQTMVLLEDIPYWLDEERLELFLESRRCKRCHVKSIDFHAENGNAVVEFEYPEGKTL